MFRYYPLNVAALVLAVWNPNEMELYYYYIFIYIFGFHPLPKFDLLFRNKCLWQFLKQSSYIMQKAEYFVHGTCLRMLFSV